MQCTISSEGRGQVSKKKSKWVHLHTALKAPLPMRVDGSSSLQSMVGNAEEAVAAAVELST